MGWPTAGDLQRYLTAAGLITATPTALEQLLELDAAIDAAVERWNDGTRFWPFLSTGTAEARRYLPPIGMLLDLDGGLLSISTLLVDCTYTNVSGTSYTHLQHFKLLPRDAPQRVHPYTAIEFIWSPQNVSDGEIEITGTWGYCLEANLPTAAKRGVLALAAVEVMPQIREQMTGGVIRWTEGDRSKQYGETEAAVAGWQSIGDKAIAQYRRLRLG